MGCLQGAYTTLKVFSDTFTFIICFMVCLWRYKIPNRINNLITSYYKQNLLIYNIDLVIASNMWLLR